MDKIEGHILRLTAERGLEKSICPSEVAKLLGEKWQSEMTAVRRAAVRLALQGRIEILRKGRAVDPKAEIRGVIRLRAAANSGEIQGDTPAEE